jgi:TatD DNase family protein
MLVDSHCHLDFPELSGDLEAVLGRMREQCVTHALSVAVTLEGFPQVRAIAERYPRIYGSVGVHPDYRGATEASEELLVELAAHPKIVAIGETGLDYYRIQGDREWQRRRFRIHVRAARRCGKPLIVHMREAAADTLSILREEGAGEVGGVMHCFTGSWEVAQAAMALGFYISFSGIVTFKNAQRLKEVARQVPLEKMLVETDSPYLAPVPYRGRTNEPALVRYVAEEIARLKKTDLEQVAAATSLNFFKLFNVKEIESDEMD